MSLRTIDANDSRYCLTGPAPVQIVLIGLSGQYCSRPLVLPSQRG
jgi:hypothetical protein